MRFGTAIDRFASAVLVLSIGVIVSGTKACQEDYELGVQAKVPSATETVTGSPTLGDDTTTPTGSPTVTGSVTPEEAGTTTPEAAETPAEEDDGTDGAENDLFAQLSKLDDEGNSSDVRPGAVAASISIKPENWLGGPFNKRGDELKAAVWIDSDSDGFSDELEEALGGDPHDAEVTPKGALVTRLGERVPSKSLTAQAKGDKVDSDSDGLPDSLEIIVGSNPRMIDSDGDGVSDGREFDLGADPVIPDERRDGVGAE
jgi:hypothetical protein